MPLDDITNEHDLVVHIENFAMSFGTRTVIEDLSFDIRRGETFGFLGSNGSGKTTTIRALLGIYRATSGSLLVEGKVFDPASGVRLGYLPEERGLYKKEPVIDVMVYFGRLKGLSHADAKQWSMEFLERVELEAQAQIRLDKLSSGQQQKVQLGVTIMNNPTLLILDEPTKGFDPINRRLLMDIIENQRRAGATVMMVTHQMDEVERLCDRVVLLKDGRAEAYGTISDVQDLYGGTTIKIRYSGVLPDSELYVVAIRERNHAELKAASGISEAQVLKYLVDSGVLVSEFSTGKPSLDEIFLKVYGSELNTVRSS